MAIFCDVAFIALCLSINYVSATCPGQGNLSCTSLANASFTKDFVQVKIKFGQSVKPVQPYDGCHSILDNATVAKLGKNPICAFSNDKTIHLYPDIAGNIKEGDSIGFKAGSIIDSNGTALNMTSVIVSEVHNAFRPNIVVTTYGYLSQCAKDLYHVSADMSRNSGYSQFSRVDWALDDVTSNDTADVVNANNYLVNKQSNISEIQVTSLIMSSNKSISINISNIFGLSEKKVIPLSQTMRPVARILGVRNVTIFENVEYYLHSELFVSKCGSLLKETNYNWRIVKNGAAQSNLLQGSFESKSLYLKPFLLSREESYSVSVNITYTLSDNSTGENTDSISIHVKKAPLVVTIIGGDRDIGRNQTFVLVGKEESGSNAVTNTMWQCTDASTGSECKTKLGTSLMLGNAANTTVSIADGNFVIGRRYQFTLTMSDSTQTASSSIIVSIIATPVPIVSINPLCHSCNANHDIAVLGTVYANAAHSSMTYTWKIFEYSGKEVTLQSPTGTLNTNLANISIPYITTLKVPNNTLNSGHMYRISLKVTFDGKDSSSSKLIGMEIPPRFGHIETEPNQGAAYNTTFRIRSYGWIAKSDTKPLLYRFGYKKGSKVRFLTGWQNFNVLGEVLLPNGDPNNGNKLDLFAEVKDANGLIAERQVTVEVSAQERNNYEHLVRHYKDSLAKKDHAAMSNAIVGIISSSLGDDSKRLHVESYFDSIESAPYYSRLASLFIDTLNDLVMLTNKNGTVFTRLSKERIARMSAKCAEAFEKSMLHTKTSQIHSLLSIFDGILPQPNEVSSNTTNILRALHNTSRILPALVCRSIRHKSQININTSLISISSGYGDLSGEFSSSPQFSASAAFRQKYLQDHCSGSRYVDCVGICWSLTSYSHKEYFLMNVDVGDAMTRIHDARLIDLNTNKSKEFSTNSKDFLLKIPIINQYNSDNETVKCVMYDPMSLRWSSDFCISDVPQAAQGTKMLHCTCSKLYAVAGIKVAKPPPTTLATTTQIPSTTVKPTTKVPAPTPAPADVITVVLNANCTKYTATQHARDQFNDSLTTDLANQMKISKSRIKVWSMTCGSIVINMTIAERDASQSSEPAKADAMTSIQGMLDSGYMRVSLPDGSWLGAVAPGVQIKTTLPPTMVTTKKLLVPNVSTNWMPMMASFGIILVVVIGVAAFIAWLHGRYYKKKRFTDINCDKQKPKLTAEEMVEKMDKKQKAKKLQSIMDESLENAEVPSIIVAAPISLRRTKRKPRITPINGSTNFHSSAASSRTTLQYSARDLPRLALDDSSSESEAETSFSEKGARPKSTMSTKSRPSSGKSVKGKSDRLQSRTENKSNDFLTPGRAKSGLSGYSSRASSSMSEK